MLLVGIFSLVILTLSFLLLCVGCREKKSNPGNGTVIAAQTSQSSPACPPPAPVTNITAKPHVEETNTADRAFGDSVDLEDGVSRHSSVSSRASVRITITNMGESDQDNLDSPGAVSAMSAHSSSSMADRELPKIPPPSTAPPQPDPEFDHDYDILEEQRGDGPPPSIPSVAARMQEYDTIENMGLQFPSDRKSTSTPDYATVRKVSGYTTIAAARRPSYEALPDLSQRASCSPGMTDNRPNYEQLSGIHTSSPITRDTVLDRSATIGAIGRGSPRPYSEIYDAPMKLIDKHRSGSERKARDNEDSVSVIYASINPEFRTRRQESIDGYNYPLPVDTDDTEEPPLPENPYAMLDNLLVDLNLPNPDNISPHSERGTRCPPADSPMRPTSAHSDRLFMRPMSANSEHGVRPTSTHSDRHTPLFEDRLYEDLEGLRGDDFATSLVSMAMRTRTNPVIMNSSPFAVSNISESDLQQLAASPVCVVDNES